MEETRLRSRIARIYKLEELLLNAPEEGLQATWMARKTGVNRRTIYRDMELMCEIGIPIWQMNGRFGVNGKYKLPTYRNDVREKLEATNEHH